MTGGTVVEVLKGEFALWVLCHDRKVRTRTMRSAIYVRRDAQSCGIKEGDIVWWSDVESSEAYWTPSGAYNPVTLEKIGASGQKRPHVDRLRSVGRPDPE